MMKAGSGANEFITVLIYVLLFGGAIVGEIVKHIRKKQAQRRLEEQLASGRPPQEPEAEIIEEREVEEEEEPREAEMPKEVPREVREIFEEVFGPTFGKNIPAEPQPSLRPSSVIKPETLEVITEEQVEKPLVKLQHLGSFKHAELKPSEATATLEGISMEKRIFKDLELSDMQKLIAYSEILGKPRALKRRRAL